MTGSIDSLNEKVDEKPRPRNRSGGVFVNLERVNFHQNDFTFEEVCDEMKENEKAVVKEYVERCYTMLDHADFLNYTGEPQSNCWNNHYCSSKNHFPLKNYIAHAFPIIKSYTNTELKSVIMECGCGTGSTLLPLLFNFPSSSCTYIGFDISSYALEHFKEISLVSSLISQQKLFLFQYDIAGAFKPEEQEKKGMKLQGNPADLQLRSSLDVNFAELKGVESDVVLLVFVLCSLPSINAMALCLRRLWNVMKPNSILLFRDYAVGDHNFFRYLSRDQSQVTDLCFKKHDGTTQMFFNKEFTLSLFSACGFDCYHESGLAYHCNRIYNRKNGKTMNKIFVNGVFQKRKTI